MLHLLRNALLLLPSALFALFALFAFVALGNAAQVSQEEQAAAVKREQQAAAQRKEQAAAFYQHLITVVSADDIKRITEIVHYPFLYGNDDQRSSGKPLEIANADELVEHYHRIFTPTIKRVLACRGADDFFTNSEGVMVGEGSLWFSLRYIGEDSEIRPLDVLNDPHYWQFRVVAVYDGKHAQHDAEQCETKQ